MAQVSPFFEQQKTCPICATNFRVLRIRSSAIRASQRMTDFQIIYSGVNLTYYQIWVCPICNYAAPDSSFDSFSGERTPVYHKLTDTRGNEPDFSQERDAATALRSYELAIRTGEIRGLPYSYLAPLYLRAAWIARDLNNRIAERKYIELALTAYEDAFSNEHLPGKSSGSTMMYLIGELNRQVGRYHDAIRWFSRAVMSPDIKREPEIERLARQQWELSRQQQKENSANVDTDNANQQAAENTEPIHNNSEQTPNHQVINMRRRNPNMPKMRLAVSLYEDQIEWLKTLSNKAYRNSKTFMEREAIVRCLIDAAIDKTDKIGDFASEEELIEAFKAVFQDD